MPELPRMAARNLPREAYPFTIRAFRESDDECVWTKVCDGPGVLYVPPLAAEHGPVYIVVQYGDGHIERAAEIRL